MIKKVCGAILVVGIPLVSGIMYLSEQKRRCAQLSLFLSLIRAIEEGAGQLRLPLDEIYSSFCDDTHTSEMFVSLLHTEAEKGGEGVLLRTLDGFCMMSACALTEEDITVLSGFAEGLGKEDLTATTRRCQTYRASLQTRLDAAEKSLLTNGRLMRLLPPLIGALLVILFL